MKRRRAWRGQWPRKSSFASFRLFVCRPTCHILLANKNKLVHLFFKRFCQADIPPFVKYSPTAWSSRLIVVGDVLNVELYCCFNCTSTAGGMSAFMKTLPTGVDLLTRCSTLPPSSTWPRWPAASQQCSDSNQSSSWIRSLTTGWTASTISVLATCTARISQTRWGLTIVWLSLTAVLWRMHAARPSCCPVTAHSLITIKTKQLSYRKEDRAMRPIYECPQNF